MRSSPLLSSALPLCRPAALPPSPLFFFLSHTVRVWDTYRKITRLALFNPFPVIKYFLNIGRLSRFRPSHPFFYPFFLYPASSSAPFFLFGFLLRPGKQAGTLDLPIPFFPLRSTPRFLEAVGRDRGGWGGGGDNLELWGREGRGLGGKGAWKRHICKRGVRAVMWFDCGGVERRGKEGGLGVWVEEREGDDRN